MADRILRGRKAWRRDDLQPGDWMVPFPDACLTEIGALVHTLRRNPMATTALDTADYRLTHCRRLMKRVRSILDSGVGFAVLDRLPVERYAKHELTAVYWLLSSLIARPVAQSFDGTLLYDVVDTGKKIAPRIRGDKTKQELAWHTDYGFNHPPPYFGLLVLRTGQSGGESFVVSQYSAHNEMRRRDKALLARLYLPYYWNRQGEHPPDDPIVNVNPVFALDGKRLNGRVNRRLLKVGYELMQEPMDDAGAEALTMLYEIMDDPALHFAFELKAGQIQYVNNWHCVHQRSAYSDYATADRRRHLVRIFLRDNGARSYMG